MLRKLIIATVGLMLLSGIGISATAQASATPSVHTKGASVRPAASEPCTVGTFWLQDVGDGQNAYDEGSWLEFYEAPDQTLFCFDYIGGTVDFQLVDYNNGKCASWNSTNTHVAMASAASCAAHNVYTEWKAAAASTTGAIEIQNIDNGKCIYDYKQVPAVFAGCASNDLFEQFLY